MKNVFAAAKVVAPEKPKTSKKSDKREVHMQGLEDYAVLDSLIKSLSAMRETLGEELKESMKLEFVKVGLETKKRPENYRGVEGDANASCELKKRSSASVLTPEEVEMLTKDSIPFENKVVSPAKYVINSAYMNDQDVLNRVGAQIAKIKDLPDDFIVMEQEDVKPIVSDETLEKVFETGLANKFIDVVSVFSIKPTMTNPIPQATALDMARKMLSPKPQAVK